MIKRVAAFILGLFAVTFAWGVQPEYCASVAGTWFDGSSPGGGSLFTFTLTQNSSGNVQGSLAENCYSVVGGVHWVVNGILHTDGTMSLSATNPSGDPRCPNSNHTFTGHFNFGEVGCAAWRSDTYDGQPWGPVTFNRTYCEVPTGEGTPVLADWATAVANWNTAVMGSSGFDFGGRVTMEAVAGPGVDNCYFSGSAVKKLDQVTGGSWAVDSGSNIYGEDSIGRDSASVWYYRWHQRAPCSYTLYQSMQIDCPTSLVPTGWSPYITNTLTYTVDKTTVTSTRAAATAQEAWFATPQQVANFIVTYSILDIMHGHLPGH